MTAPTTRETADHAELARLAEAAKERARLLRTLEVFSEVSSSLDGMADGVSALLSEIAALRGEGAKFADFIIQMNAPDQGESLTDDERLMFAVASKFRAFLANQGAE